jgi:hypothetical protein
LESKFFASPRLCGEFFSSHFQLSTVSSPNCVQIIAHKSVHLINFYSDTENNLAKDFSKTDYVVNITMLMANLANFAQFLKK